VSGPIYPLGGFVTCSPSEQVQNFGLLPLPHFLGLSTTVSSLQVQDTGRLPSEQGDGRGGRVGLVTCSPSEQVQNFGLLPLPHCLGLSTTVSFLQVQDTGGLLSEQGDGRGARVGGAHVLSSAQVQELGLFPLPQSLGLVTVVPSAQMQDATVDPGQGLFLRRFPPPRGTQFTLTMVTKNNQRKTFMIFKS